MTDASTPKPALGVGTLVSAGFRTYSGNFMPFYLAIALPMLLNVFVVMALRPDTIEELAAPSLGPQLLQMVIGIAAMALMALGATRLTADAAAGRPVRLSGAFAGLGRAFLPLMVLTLFGTVMFMAGFIAFVLPGLWLGAAMFVMAPAIILGGAGFGGLARSWRLTKGYRWPLIALLILLMVILALSMIAGNLVQVVMLGVGDFQDLVVAQLTVGPAVLVASTLVSALLYPVIFIVPALTYLRLVDIKEHGGAEALTDVFA